MADLQDRDLDTGQAIEWYIAGRQFDVFDDAGVDPERNTLSVNPFGVREPRSNTKTTGGSLTLTAATAKAWEQLSTAILGYNPDTHVTGLYADPDAGIVMPVFRMVRTPDDTSYMEVEYLGCWKPSPVRSVQNGPTDLQRGQFTGPCGRARMVIRGSAWSEKVALTLVGSDYTGNLAETPEAIDENPFYGLEVVLLSGPDDGPIVAATMDNSAQYIAADGSLTIPETEASNLGWTPTDAWVLLDSETATGTAKNGDFSMPQETFWT
jgi:hypothetical protein